jgi:hypothetical protein
MDLKKLKDTAPWEWPESAGKMILDVLRDNQAGESDRLLAAELAGDYTVINEALAKTLLSAVRSGDEAEELRGKAAISLGPVLEHSDIYGFQNPDDILIPEELFLRIQESLHQLYMNDEVPKEVRRRILEASVRAPQGWHREAVQAAYSSEDEAWKLTGIFCMRFVRGFDTQILEALNSKNPDIHYQAVCAAGNWQLDAAWPHIAALITPGITDKPLLLAAIEASASIRPQEASEILSVLTNSNDEEIVEAVYEALTLAGGTSEDEDSDKDDDDEFHG